MGEISSSIELRQTSFVTSFDTDKRASINPTSIQDHSLKSTHALLRRTFKKSNDMAINPGGDV